MSDGTRRRIAAAGLALLLATFGGAVHAAAQEPIEERGAGEVEALRQRARTGDAKAQYELGTALMARNDDPALREARDWLRKAMRAGHLEAQNAYAALLMTGSGGSPDAAEGRRLLFDAARRGSVGANVSLSMNYGNGTGGFKRDPRLAFQHMQAAARVDLPENGWTLWRVGMMHLEGVGTPKDAAEAYRWVVRAADKGSIDGMISRAVMLATGEGVAENQVEARSWYERAARSGKNGWAHALRSLGGMLVIGEGGPVDLPRGFGYLLAARAAGDRNAGIVIERLGSRMTPEVERQAQAVAQEWVKALPTRD
jgi:TPR repeat protein